MLLQASIPAEETVPPAAAATDHNGGAFRAAVFWINARKKAEADLSLCSENTGKTDFSSGII